MNKGLFNVKTDNIDVPTEELFSAIEKDLEKGRRNRKIKQKTWIAMSFASIAASLILISGFAFSPMTKVLANVPVIGSIYESLHLNMGKELEAKNLITELNQTASDNGVDVTLTSVYYDGVYVGITFKAEGEDLSNEINRDGLVLDYDYYLYKEQINEQEVKMGWGGRMSSLQEVENYYTFSIELEYPDKQLPKDFTLPMTFTFMGGVEGTWQFDIPVTQLPLKTYTIENSISQDENYSFTMESMVIGESNMRLDYTTNIPEDFLHLIITDDKGNKSPYDTLLRYGPDSATFESGIKDDINYLIIHPMYRMDEKTIELEPIKVNLQNN